MLLDKFKYLAITVALARSALIALLKLSHIAACIAPALLLNSVILPLAMFCSIVCGFLNNVVYDGNLKSLIPAMSLPYAWSVSLAILDISSCHLLHIGSEDERPEPNPLTVPVNTEPPLSPNQKDFGIKGNKVLFISAI